jgi:hypothetical protein
MMPDPPDFETVDALHKTSADHQDLITMMIPRPCSATHKGGAAAINVVA